MKNPKKLGLVSLVLLNTFNLTGCMTQKKAEKILSQTPQYLQENVGEIKVEPLNPIFLLSGGNIVEYIGPNSKATIHLSLFAAKDRLFEILIHSLEFKLAHNKPKVSEGFYDDFYQGDQERYKKYPGLPLKALILLSHLYAPIPIERIPIPGYPDIYSYIDHFEAVAGFGVKVLNGAKPRKNDDEYNRRLKCVERFITGAYGQPNRKAEDYLEKALERREENIPKDNSEYLRRLLSGFYEGPQKDLKKDFKTTESFLRKIIN